MQHINKHISLLAVSVFALSLLAVVPVSAQTEVTEPAAGGTSAENKARAQERKEEAVKRASEKAQERADDRSAIKAGAGDNATGEEQVASLKQKALKLLQEERKDGKQNSAAARKKACEARKASLENRTENYGAQATRHLEVFDGIYDKIEAFQAKKQFTVEDLEALETAVEAKRAAAVDATEVLTSLDPEIDCASADPAETVATLKAAVTDAREALHEYRISIKDLLVALRQAAVNQPSKTQEEAN